MQNLENKIKEVVLAKPGMKAAFIAQKLGLSRKEINACLYGRLLDVLEQDVNYRWYPKGFAVDRSKFLNAKGKKHVVESFRGRSLFTYEIGTSVDSIVYNKNNVFFKEVYSELEDSQKQVIDSIFYAFCDSMDLDYDMSDFFDDFIEKWGILLEKRIKDLK